MQEEMKKRQERLLFYRNSDKSKDRESYDKARILNLFEGEPLSPRDVDNALYVCGTIGENVIKKYMKDLAQESLLIEDKEGKFSRNF